MGFRQFLDILDLPNPPDSNQKSSLEFCTFLRGGGGESFRQFFYILDLYNPPDSNQTPENYS